MLTQSLYHRFEKEGILFNLCLYVRTFVSRSVSSSVRPINIFVASFSWTTLQGFLTEFGFRVYWSRLFRVMRFRIQYSTTSCLPKYLGEGYIISSSHHHWMFLLFIDPVIWKMKYSFLFRLYTYFELSIL